jgi:hypothetical protein
MWTHNDLQFLFCFRSNLNVSTYDETVVHRRKMLVAHGVAKRHQSHWIVSADVQRLTNESNRINKCKKKICTKRAIYGVVSEPKHAGIVDSNLHESDIKRTPLAGDRHTPHTYEHGGAKRRVELGAVP